ncbi:MAG: hypothetical protein IPK60_12690 [Sandaracinaceae bacterium]|nr:hypothetical protein [Sandaracinaceae bacterium]
MKTQPTTTALSIFLLLVVACGSDRNGPSAFVGNDSGMGDEDSGAEVDSGVGATTIDAAAMCAKITASIGECSAVSASDCEIALNMANTRGCGAWLDDLQTWVSGTDAPYTCQTFPGIPPTATISGLAPELAQVGDACAGAIVRNDCYGISCVSWMDCPTGSTCNDATGHCLTSASSFCAGTPCSSWMDCATGDTCNEALGICIHNS